MRRFYLKYSILGNSVNEFKAANALERALETARSDQSSIPEFLGLFCKSDIAILSVSEVMADGSGLQPLMFEKEGTSMVACFTSMERIGSFTDRAQYCLVTKADYFLRCIPAGYGLVLNPGQPVGFDITPDGLRDIVADLV